jgi:hypothetical protein
MLDPQIYFDEAIKLEKSPSVLEYLIENKTLHLLKFKMPILNFIVKIYVL